MNKHWLFFYDGIAETLEIVEYGDKDAIRAKLNELTKGFSYIRQWTADGMTHIDFGSHWRFFKIYPSMDVLAII